MIPFGYGINHDLTHFSSPSVFRPSRHLNAEGRFVRDDHLLFFGVGKRKCPGELLARAELFLFVASLVQNLRLRPASEKQPLDLSSAVPGTVFYPKDFEFVVQDRGIRLAA